MACAYARPPEDTDVATRGLVVRMGVRSELVDRQICETNDRKFAFIFDG